MRFITLILLAGIALAQTNVLSVVPGEKVRVKRNESVTAKVHLQLRPGYHVNSNTPAESYLIPLKLTWKADPLEAGEITYPKPALEKYQFSEKPVSVFSGDFEIATKFKAPANAPNGPAMIGGKLRYQACNDRMCLPPKTIDVPLTVAIQ